MKEYKNRKPNRLNNYDYSNNGYYYVTICTYNREYLFGEVLNDQMILNQFGYIAQNSWQDLPNHHKNIELDKFIVMPNHVHGIIIINNPVGNRPACSSNMPDRSFNKYQKTDNLSVIIGSYKSTVTKQINRIDNNRFKWQKSFHDHIIRIDKSLQNIQEYIVDNPKTWDMDENNIKNYSIEIQAGLNPTG